MDQTWPGRGRRERLASPPPPSSLSEVRLHWSLCPLAILISSLSSVLSDLYDAATTFHRVLILELLSIVAVIRFISTGEPDPLLGSVLEMIKVGLVGGCIYAVTAQLRRRCKNNMLLRRLLCRATFVFGSSTEMALTLVLFRQGKIPAAERVLVGSVYAKILLIGTVCLISGRRIPGQAVSGAQATDFSDIIRLLIVAGLLVLSSAPHILSESAWVAKGVPLFLILHAGFMYRLVSRQNLMLRAQRPRSGDESSPDRRRTHIRDTVEAIVLVAMLIALRIVVIDLLQRLSTRLHFLAMPALNDTGIYFVMLPLIVVLIDQSANIGLALEGDLEESSTNVFQSLLTTYFFLRPLAALGGYSVDPAGGRAGLGGALLFGALWLQMPRVSRNIKGGGMLAAYAYICFVCATNTTWSDGLISCDH